MHGCASNSYLHIHLSSESSIFKKPKITCMKIIEVYGHRYTFIPEICRKVARLTPLVNQLEI